MHNGWPCVAFSFLKDHALRHGEGMSYEEYLNHAIANMRNGRAFNVWHNGLPKTAFITRVGEDEFWFTSASRNMRRIMTHMRVDAQYLRNKGITLPKGF